VIFVLAYGAMLYVCEDFYWVPYQMFSRAIFWLLLVLVPIVSVLIDYTAIYVQKIFWPTPIDIAVEIDRSVRMMMMRMMVMVMMMMMMMNFGCTAIYVAAHHKRRGLVPIMMIIMTMILLGTAVG
jgi:magnesium-transporting ATPase (P-type)